MHESRHGNTLFAFFQHWAVCLVMVTGMVLLCFSSLQLAVFVLERLAILFGTPPIDGISRTLA